MRTAYTVARVTATGFGAALIGLDSFYSWEHFRDPAAPILTMAAALTLPFAEIAWQHKRRALSFGLGALTVLLITIAFTAALERTASQRDAKVGEKRDGNSAITETRAALAKIEASAKAECGKRGPECRKLEAEERTLRKELAGLGAEKIADSMGSRMAQVLPLTQAQIALVQPMLLPVALQLGGILFLAFAAAPSAAETPVKRKARTPAPKPPASKPETARKRTRKAKLWPLGQPKLVVNNGR